MRGYARKAVFTLPGAVAFNFHTPSLPGTEADVSKWNGLLFNHTEKDCRKSLDEYMHPELVFACDIGNFQDGLLTQEGDDNWGYLHYKTGVPMEVATAGVPGMHRYTMCYGKPSAEIDMMLDLCDQDSRACNRGCAAAAEYCYKTKEYTAKSFYGSGCSEDTQHVFRFTDTFVGEPVYAEPSDDRKSDAGLWTFVLDELKEPGSHKGKGPKGKHAPKPAAKDALNAEAEKEEEQELHDEEEDEEHEETDSPAEEEAEKEEKEEGTFGGWLSVLDEVPSKGKGKGKKTPPAKKKGSKKHHGKKKENPQKHKKKDKKDKEKEEEGLGSWLPILDETPSKAKAKAKPSPQKKKVEPTSKHAAKKEGEKEKKDKKDENEGFGSWLSVLNEVSSKAKAKGKAPPPKKEEPKKEEKKEEKTGEEKKHPEKKKTEEKKGDKKKDDGFFSSIFDDVQEGKKESDPSAKPKPKAHPHGKPKPKPKGTPKPKPKGHPDEPKPKPAKAPESEKEHEPLLPESGEPRDDGGILPDIEMPDFTNIFNEVPPPAGKDKEKKKLKSKPKHKKTATPKKKAKKEEEEKKEKKTPKETDKKEEKKEKEDDGFFAGVFDEVPPKAHAKSKSKAKGHPKSKAKTKAKGKAKSRAKKTPKREEDKEEKEEEEEGGFFSNFNEVPSTSEGGESTDTDSSTSSDVADTVKKAVGDKIDAVAKTTDSKVAETAAAKVKEEVNKKIDAAVKGNVEDSSSKGGFLSKWFSGWWGAAESENLAAASSINGENMSEDITTLDEVPKETSTTKKLIRTAKDTAKKTVSEKLDAAADSTGKEVVKDAAEKAKKAVNDKIDAVVPNEATTSWWSSWFK